MSNLIVWESDTVGMNNNYHLLYRHSFLPLVQSATLTMQCIRSGIQLCINIKVYSKYLAVLTIYNTNSALP